MEKNVDGITVNDNVIIRPEIPCILYVDDEPNNLESFKAGFRREFKIHVANSAKEARKILESEEIHIILSDQRMPEETGIELFESIKEEYKAPVRLLITGYSDIDAVIDAINKGGIYKYISKPWDENDLRITLNNAFELYMLKAENKQLMKSLLRANEQLEFMLRQKLLS